MKIVAVIVLFCPDENLLSDNIKSFCAAVDGIYVWDNSPQDTSNKNRELLTTLYPQVVIDGDGKNHGVSFALNRGWQYAKENHYDTLLTMDQDSIFQSFPTYKNRVLNKWAVDGISLCGPTPYTDKRQFTGQGFRKCSSIITSGMLVPLRILEKVNGYCEEFLVDAIDIDFCYKAYQNGYEVYIDENSRLTQNFGLQQSRQFLGITFYGSGYSAFRLYGIFRNHIITWRRYNHPSEIAHNLIRLYFYNYLIKGVLMVESDKIKKFKAAIKGICDGLRYTI